MNLESNSDKPANIDVEESLLHHGANPKLSFNDVMNLAGTLNVISSSEEIKDVLKIVIDNRLGRLHKYLVLKKMAESTKIGRECLKHTLEKLGLVLRLNPKDSYQKLAVHVLKKDYADGLHLLRCADHSYWVYDKTHWRPTTESQIRHNLLMASTKDQFGDSGKTNNLVRSAKTFLDDLLGTDEDVLGLSYDPPSVTNCANGEIWIDAEGKSALRLHRPESRLTHCLPIKYDTEAKCPIYDKTLLEIFAGAHDPEEVVRHWHEFVGYAIQPLRDIPSFWLLIGHGNNGKSKLLSTVQRLVGSDAVLNEQISTFQRDRFNVAALAEKLIFIDDDMAEDVVLADGLLKKLSETKEMSARHAYGRQKFNFTCRVLPIMAGNSYPQTRDLSFGMLKRAYVIPFGRIFSKEEANPKLFEKIWEDELAGVLNRSLQGLQRLRERGGFEVPVDCEEAKQTFFAHAHPLIAFLKECCVDDPSASTNVSEFRDALKDWGKEQGIRSLPVGNKLIHKLKSQGYEVAKVKGYPRIKGLKLKKEA